MNTTLAELRRRVEASRVYDVVRRTPLEHAPRLSARVGCHVHLKREDQQHTFSFKLRGAYERMVALSLPERTAGVITVSAGNHAQGVAFSARHLGIRATVVMPGTTPRIKIDAVQALGARVVLFGTDFVDADQHCRDLARRDGSILIHPFDDPLVVAGQGTIGLEIVAQGPSAIDAVFVPVGGGGLISGVGGYLKAIGSEIRVIGVEPMDADAMARSLEAGGRVRLQRVGRFADGVAVPEVGEYCYRVAAQVVDDIVRVTDDEICAAIRDIFVDTRAIVEPAGALAVAGITKYCEAFRTRPRCPVAVLSGANVDFDRLGAVARRLDQIEGAHDSRAAILASVRD